MNGTAADHAAHASGGDISLGLLLWLLALFLLYLRAAAREPPHRARWSLWRSASFGTGMVLLAVAIVPPVAHYAHRSLEGHMLQHLLLGMFAPLFLVLGAPGTLLLRSLSATSARRLVRLLDTGAVRFLIHPFTALTLDMGGMALLYLTPLYALSTREPALHAFIHVHFLVSGTLFTWAIAGPDPAPRRPGWRVRLLALFLGTAVHAILGKWMYAYGYPRGTSHSLEEIQAAAKLMYYGGDLAELLLTLALFLAWRHARSRHSALGHRDSTVPRRVRFPLTRRLP